METESALDCNQWKRLVYVSSKVQLLMSVWNVPRRRAPTHRSFNSHTFGGGESHTFDGAETRIVGGGEARTFGGGETVILFGLKHKYAQC